MSRRWLRSVLWVLAVLPPALMAAAADAVEVDAAASLAGQFLVASPKMPDPRFERTVILMLNHDERGAMGLVINRSYGSGPLKSLLEGFGVEKAPVDGTVSLRYGGPVEPGRGFVLHSVDYAGPSTRTVVNGVALSTGPDILEAVASGDGPRRVQFLIGYAGWGPGQLEGELGRDDWLVAPAEDRLIFSEDPARVWEEALRHAGTPL